LIDINIAGVQKGSMLCHPTQKSKKFQYGALFRVEKNILSSAFWPQGPRDRCVYTVHRGGSSTTVNHQWETTPKPKLRHGAITFSDREWRL